MRDRAIYQSLNKLLITALLLVGPTARAIPPEGLEAFSLLGGTRSAAQPLYIQAGYHNPSYLSDYESLQVYTSMPNAHGNYFTYGAMLTKGSQFSDRSGYFVRYDQTFSGNSFSLKLAHIDYSYLQAGKNTVSAAYNTGFNLGPKALLYLSLGAYYRFTIHSWQGAPWNPLNFNTDDREFYFEMCFGTQTSLGKSAHLTLDLNNRDPYFSHNGDNLALDLGIYLNVSRDITLRTVIGHRFSGLLVGTADIGEQYGFLGIISRL